MAPDTSVSFYTEELVFRTYNPGTPKEHTALMPSELDLAVINQRIGKQTAEIERLETQPEPREIKRQREALTKLAPAPGEVEKPEFTLAMERIRAYDNQRMWELEGFTANRYRAQAQLKRAIKQVDDAPPPNAKEFTRVFQFRDLEYEERLQSEDKTTSIDPKTNLKSPDLAKRDLMLLRAVYMGEVINGGNTVQKKDPGTLSPAIADTLIMRFWARASMDPDLEDYFRGSGPADRGAEYPG